MFGKRGRLKGLLLSLARYRPRPPCKILSVRKAAFAKSWRSPVLQDEKGAGSRGEMASTTPADQKWPQSSGNRTGSYVIREASFSVGIRPSGVR
jgi:hypothetical protein